MLKSTAIIPTYNRPAELRNCINSLLEQTVKPDELIVIDDGNLFELPLEKECKNAGIRYVYFNNQLIDLGKGIDSAIYLFPKIDTVGNGQIKIEIGRAHV